MRPETEEGIDVTYQSNKICLKLLYQIKSFVTCNFLRLKIDGIPNKTCMFSL